MSTATDERLIILPGDPEYHWTLGTNLPPGWNTTGMVSVVRKDTGLAELVDSAQLREYLDGGEHDEVLAGYEDDEDDYEWVEIDL